jgi:hypothetical protein
MEMSAAPNIAKEHHESGKDDYFSPKMKTIPTHSIVKTGK